MVGPFIIHLPLCFVEEYDFISSDFCISLNYSLGTRLTEPTQSTVEAPEAQAKPSTCVTTKDQWDVGTYNLSGTGTLNFTNGTLYVGRYGMGTFTQKGGTLPLPGNMVLGEQVIASQKIITTGVGTFSAKTTTYNYIFLDRTTGTYKQ